MTRKARPFLAAVSFALALFIAAVLIDKLGGYRWFWPYDNEIYGVLLLLITVVYAFFGERLRNWFAEQQASSDNKAGEP